MKKFFIINMLVMLVLTSFSYAQEKVVKLENHIVEEISNDLIRYTNKELGYQIEVDDNLELKLPMDKYISELRSDELEVEVYYDDLSEHSSFLSYVNYTTKFLNDEKSHTFEYKESKKLNGKPYKLFKWSRDKIKNIEHDRNHYVLVLINMGDNKAYTIFIKSEDEFKDYNSYMDIVKSFKITDKIGMTRYYEDMSDIQIRDNFNEVTTNFVDKYFINNKKLHWGIFEPTAPTAFDYLNSLEKQIDYDFNFLLKYQTFDSTFPLNELEEAYKRNEYVELTFQTMFFSDPSKNKGILYDIIDGKYDDYFKEYARLANEFDKPILFRLNNEMNGDWCVYSSFYHSMDTDIYKDSYRYVYNIFEEAGANDNVLWVWNPHDISFPKFKWNDYMSYYPGDKYVDVVGLTGYNTGTYYKGEVWREFAQIYPELYRDYDEKFNKPFIITEFGSNKVGGDKVNWVNQMFDEIRYGDYKKLKIAIWWNGIDWDTKGNPARTYRLDKDPNVIEAFKKGLMFY